jgi:hypothetical protein
MTETTPPADGDTAEDPLRRHSEDPAEGADPADAGTRAEPREHPEEPAEG